MASCKIPNKILVIGGGISGVSCASTLAALSQESDYQITLISSSPVLKTVSNFRQRGSNLEEFDVVEQPSDGWSQQFSNISVINDVVIKLDSTRKIVFTENAAFEYDKICICAGAKPKLIDCSCPEYVLGIRDTSSVQEFRNKLTNSKRIVGNGGIATELVYSIQFCQIVWAIRDSSFGSTFFDPGAAEFLSTSLNKAIRAKESITKRIKFTSQAGDQHDKIPGSALGPDWELNKDMKGLYEQIKDVKIEFSCELTRVYRSQDVPNEKFSAIEGENITCSQDLKWSVYAELNNGKLYGCDFIVSATGVTANVQLFLNGNQFKISEGGGICVDREMRSSISDVYAAGDVCSADWEWDHHWFQMRLWTQARQMGLFSHVTKFFGFKVILLGLYNGQKLDNQYEIHLRMKQGEEYVKVIMKNGKMEGALLIGETDLEESFENLIINQLDLSHFPDLLNPSIDIEDYFD